LIYGNDNYLKTPEKKRLEKFYRRRIRDNAFVDADFAEGLAELASDIGRIVAVLADRKGEVQYVVVGEATRVYLPDIGRHRAGGTRLRELRLVMAKPVKAAKKPFAVDKDLITDLEKLHLDAVVVIETLATGQMGRVAVAMLTPSDERHTQEIYRDVHALPREYKETIAALEEELGRKSAVQTTKAKSSNTKESAVLVGVYTSPKKIWEPSLIELQELAKTAGVNVVGTTIQQRKDIDSRTIVGKGKLEEICLDALHKGANMIIFDRDLSPSQLNAITDETELKVLDRTMLILDIFAQRAKTRGGKLQVELAQLKYSLPRLSKRQSGMSRLTGGIGGVGPGETKLEMDKRRAKDKITRLDEEIEKLRAERQLSRRQRNQNEVPVIAILGYTNAGKSTLLNQLTGADVYAKDELFATLDPTSRRLRFPRDREVILVDTVGFIRDLPQGLINAFRATLEELHEADLLLNVVDATDPYREAHIAVVDQILADLKIDNPRRLIVLNKCDKLTEEETEILAKKLTAIPISARTKAGFDSLVNQCVYELWQADVL
jgi:GTP-binding protein HflX